jgi:hypothetical protein
MGWRFGGEQAAICPPGAGASGNAGEAGRYARAFCGKDAAPVERMIAGPDLFNCDECVRAASDSIAKERAHHTAG